MKFLVLGASGMAGHTIALYLKERGHVVDGFSRRKVSICNSIVGDARNEKDIREIIREGKYDIVINAIGILNQYAEQYKDQAVYLNSFLPHFLAEITKDMHTRVIHMSTDCVFAGNSGPYTEESFCDGRSFYDRSKALGELRDEKNLTIRTSIIGPDMSAQGIGLLNWFMKQEKEVSGYVHAMWTGVTTLELANIMEEAAQNGITGLHHMVYEKNISKYELLKLFNRYLRKDKITIHKNEEIYLDKTLVRTNFDFSYQVPDYEKMIAEMTEWMKVHKALYPHYNLEEL
ncbi:SDR family oxidoreductase [Roseburia sp. 499]|uniref:SDR family oxidoreductase n=1 Tax=Roseburia sp. 499 TaxID=1261634 RepID=UPI000951B84E|nr:SDR family oxidoreductase [Roseburia sp. 499]WVK70030.1 SDR family oxidoreductase [Roseburia sp. 499]